jgi:hypothetical protein
MSRLEIEAVSSFLKYTHAPEVSLFLKEFWYPGAHTYVKENQENPQYNLNKTSL